MNDALALVMSVLGHGWVFLDAHGSSISALCALINLALQIFWHGHSRPGPEPPGAATTPEEAGP